MTTRVALLMVMVAMTGASVHAQSTSDTLESRISRTAMAAMARCNIHGRESETGRVLDLPLGLQQRREVARYSRDRCFPIKGAAYDQLLFRGALFTELWRQRVKAEGARQPYKPVLKAIDLNMPVAESDVQSRLVVALLRFAKCVEGGNPAGVRDVLGRETASAEQDEAFEKIGADITHCASNNPNLVWNKAIIEGALAEILYRSPPVDSILKGAQ